MTTDLATIQSTPAETNILAQHFATRLTGIDLINGAFIRTTATVGNDGFLTVNVTQSPPGFAGPDYTVQVLLHMSPPEPITTTPPDTPEPNNRPTIHNNTTPNAP